MNKTGLKPNVITGLISSFWSGLAAIVVIPFYLSLLGAANFGLVVFSTTLLGLFAILDLGFATTINREVARGIDPADPNALPELLRALATVYWTVSIVAGGLTFLAAGPIAGAFLTSASVAPGTTVLAVRLMAVIVMLRLPAGLYLGVLMGGQRIVAANLLTIVVTTLSTFGSLAVLKLSGGGVLVFLAWQAVVSALNVFVLARIAWRILADRRGTKINLRQLERIWRFSSSIAVTTVIGALILQLDKLVLARFAPLEIVGQYGVAGAASRALLLVVAPVFAALYPRLTELLTRGEHPVFIDFYRSASRALTCVLTAAVVFFVLNAHDILAIWTRSDLIARRLEVVAPILLVGTALNGIMYVPHAVQLAYGNARIAFLNNLGMMAFLAPAVFLLVPRFGMLGAASGWLGANIVNLLLGIWLTHRELLPGLASRWLVYDVAAPTLLTGAMPVAVMLLFPMPHQPVARLIVSAAAAGIGLLLGLCSVAQVRAAALDFRRVALRRG